MFTPFSLKLESFSQIQTIRKQSDSIPIPNIASRHLAIYCALSHSRGQDSSTRHLATHPQVCLVVSLTVVFCSDLTASSIVSIGRAAWIRYTLKSPRQETTPKCPHKDDHPSCPNSFNTMPNIHKYPSKTATLGLNQAQPSYYTNTQKGLCEQDPKHPGNPVRALFLAQAVTPPCRCRPVPTRQKVRWDHSMPSRPTCACRCRLLLATRLFQIPPDKTPDLISFPLIARSDRQQQYCMVRG